MSELRVRLESANPHETFGPGAGWQAEVSGWRLAVADDGLVIGKPADGSSAGASERRLSAEDLLRSWQAAAFLRDQHEIVFGAAAAGDGPTVGPLLGAREHVYRRANAEYPRPDPEFRLSPLVERLLGRFAGFEAGTDDLVVTVRSVLQELEAELGSSDERLADALNVEAPVVRTLRELVARAGGDDGGGQDAADRHALYRGPEWQWLQEALRRVILQAGRRSAEAPPRVRLAMGDFVTEL